MIHIRVRFRHLLAETCHERHELPLNASRYSLSGPFLIRSIMIRFSVLTFIATAAVAASACSPGPGAGAGSGNGSGSGDGDDGTIDVTGDGDDGTIDVTGDGDGDGLGQIVEEPQNCADAAASQSYVGCDFWPTITPNPVWKDFEFAVVMANGTQAEAEVTITGPNGYSLTDTIPAGQLKSIKLPWVEELKGPEFNIPLTTGARHDQKSQSMEGGAYHVMTSVPVSTWQFSPLNFSKDIADCGSRIQAAVPATATGCRAASNDASLLLPSTAMTGNYRVTGYTGGQGSAEWGSTPGGFAITATKDGTTVQVQLPPNCDAVYTDTSNGCVTAGGLVPAAVKDEVLTFEMNAGDVIQLLGAYGPYPQIAHADLAGSLINATQPVQVIAFTPITFLPDETSNPDHIEEIVLPAEVIGNEYIVSPPSAHSDGASVAVGHVVRLYGNVDGTQLTYPEGKPAGAPDVINAGEVVELPPRAAFASCVGNPGACMLTEPFVVQGDQPFAVNSYQLGGKLQAPTWPEEYAQPGDPAVSMMVTPEQFRQNYTFLAPADFMSNWADITVPTGADVVLDGAPVATTPTPIGASGWGILRVKLDGAAGGIHTLSTTHEKGLGLQVSGFGNATSYYYPGGLDLKLISEPPVIVVK